MENKFDLAMAKSIRTYIIDFIDANNAGLFQTITFKSREYNSVKRIIRIESRSHSEDYIDNESCEISDGMLVFTILGYTLTVIRETK